MSIKKYKKLLHSSCLVTIASLSLGMSANFTHAGFEWTPPPEPVRPAPQKVLPAPVEPVEEGMATDPQNIMKSLSPVTDKSLPPVIDRSNEQPKMKVKVLTPDETVPMVQKVETQAVTEPVVEHMPEPLRAMPEEPMPKKVPMVEPAKNTHKEKAINVDLFPMGKKAENSDVPSNLTPVILPSDPEKGLDDLNSEDLVANAGNKKMAEKIIWSAPENYDVIEGFGSEMPLVLALRQIVPSKYAYSIGNEINLGQKVSWEGGKPWNEVLTSTLAPIGIGFDIKGNRLHLNKAAMPEKAASKPPAAEMTPMPVKKIEEPVVEAHMEEKPSEAMTPMKEISKPTAKVKEPEIQPTIVAKSTMPEKTVEKMEAKTSDRTTSSVSRRAILDPGKTESTQDDIIKQVMGKDGPEPKKIKITKKQDAPIETPVIEMATEKMEMEVEKPTPMPEAKIAPYVEDITFNAPPEPKKNKIMEPAPSAEPKLTLEQVNTKMHVWKANSGHNVKKLLEKWSSELDVTLDWQGNEKIKLKQNVLINGTFKNALKILFDQDTVKALDYDLVEADGGVKLSVKPRS